MISSSLALHSLHYRRCSNFGCSLAVVLLTLCSNGFDTRPRLRTHERHKCDFLSVSIPSQTCMVQQIKSIDFGQRWVLAQELRNQGHQESVLETISTVFSCAHPSWLFRSRSLFNEMYMLVSVRLRSSVSNRLRHYCREKTWLVMRVTAIESL